LPLAPLAVFLPAPARAADEVPRAGAEHPAELAMEPFQDLAFIEARRSGSPVALYFEADWCAPCREMHARTFVAPGVLAAAAGYRFFRVDMTEPSRAVDLLRQSFRVAGAPTVILFDAGGRESSRGFGFIAPEEFQRMLEKARGTAQPAPPPAVPPATPPARPAPPALPQA
jgi:thiol:disulfide interchange protein